jgi:hypothetical protein
MTRLAVHTEIDAPIAFRDGALVLLSELGRSEYDCGSH